MGILLRIFAFFGVLLVLAIATLATIAGLAFGNIGNLAKDAAAYADESIAAYGASWDGKALLDRASPELKDVFNDDPAALQNMSATLQTKVGALTSAQPAVCDDYDLNFTDEDGRVFVARCSALGETEYGSVEFTLNVTNVDDDWKVHGFFVRIIEAEERNDVLQASYGRRPALRSTVSKALAPMANNRMSVSLAPLGRVPF